MWLHLDLYHEVARRAYRTEVTHFAYPQVNSVVHTLGDANGFLNRVEN